MLSSSTNTKFFVHLKSSSTSQFIEGKSRDPKKLLKYYNGTTTSVFKGGISGCGHAFQASSGPGRVGLSSLFPTIFASYLNGLPSEASLSSTSLILSL